MSDESASAVPLSEPPYTSQGFLTAAQRFAQAALRNYTPGEAPFFYLHAGAAVELGIKAALCRASPALLVEGQRFSDDALIRLVGYQPAARRKGSGSSRAARERFPYTVGFAKALERFELLYGDQSLGVVRSALDELKGARDLTAHASSSTEQVSETMHDILMTVATVFENLLPLLGSTQEDFWGEHLGTIQHATEAQKDVVTAQARGLISAARERFATQYAGVDPEGMTLLLTESFWQRPLADDEWRRTCPACGAEGISRLRAEKRMEGDASGRSRTARGYKAIDFRCHICKLVLESELLVDAAPDFESWDEEFDLDLWAEDFGVEDLDEDDLRALGIEGEEGR